jgi:tetratricopeptide (TPR) repeat protein
MRSLETDTDLTRALPPVSLPRPMPRRGARRQGLRRLAPLLVLLATAGALGGCDGGDADRSVTRVAEAADVSGDTRIDQQLMVALAQAKNFHRRAKVYMSDGNVPQAIESVRAILSLRFPAGAAETEDVRADARALLAKLMIGRGELEEAARVVDEGLAAASRESFFVANLYTVKGEIHEARAAAAVAAGEDGQAAMHRREAIRAFSRSIEINSAIQRRLYEGAAQ